MSASESCEIGCRIRRLFNRGFVRESLNLLELALAEAPDDGRLWELLGIISHTQRQFDDAIDALETATTLVPLSDAGQITLGECYSLTKRPESARCIFVHLAAKSELRPEFLPMLAACLGRVGEYSLALSACRRSIAHDPTLDGAYFAMAKYMGKLGYPPETILPVVKHAYDLDPENLRYRVHAAVIHTRCGYHRRAFSFLKNLRPEEIHRVNCQCCLVKLAEIFAYAGDRQRYGWCREQLGHLRRKSSGGDCC